MSDIFISYASEDRFRIHPLVALLEDRGWSVWWDRELIAGPAFSEEIQCQLDAARCIIVAWSQHSINSNWCKDEASEGLSRKCLVPVMIDDVRPPLGFRSSHTANMLTWPRGREGLDDLMSGIEACLGNSQETPAPRTASNLIGTHGAVEHRSIAVLPFADRSPEADQDWFCDGLVEDLVAELSRIPHLLVISRNTTLHYRATDRSLGDIGSELGAEFIVQGSVRRAGDRIRLTAVLDEVASGRTLWSDRFDRKTDDIFTVQDELIARIMDALDVQLLFGQRSSGRQGRTRNLQASEALYKGIFEFQKFEHKASAQARRHLEEFIEMEPGSVIGYAWLATSYVFGIVVGWDSPDTAIPRLMHFLEEGLRISPNDARMLVNHAYFNIINGDLDQALDSARGAVGEMPSFDEAWIAQAWTLMLMGEPHKAIDSFEQGVRLSPIQPSTNLGLLGTAYRNAGRYEDAIRSYTLCTQQNPDFIFAHTGLATVYAMMGDLEAARREVRHALEMEPDYTIKRFVTPNLYRHPDVMDHCARVLREAGLPEG